MTTSTDAHPPTSISGLYLGDSKYSLTVTISTGICTASHDGDMTLIDFNQFRTLIAKEQDGNCALPTNLTGTRLWTRKSVDDFDVRARPLADRADRAR